MSDSHNANPKRLREEARSLASDDQGPRAVWSELKAWASKRGPVARKVAVFEFLSRYSIRPEAAPLFPEVLQNASEVSPSLSEKERKYLIEMADNASMTAKGGFTLPVAFNPGKDNLLNVPVTGKRPTPLLSFKPAKASESPQLGSLGSLVPFSDQNHPIHLREMMFDISKKLHELPAPVDAPRKKQKRQEQPLEIMSFSMPLGSSRPALKAGKRGGELVRSLIEKMKEHATEKKPRKSHPSRTAKTKAVTKKKPKKAKLKSETRKAKAKPKGKPKRKPAKRKVVRKKPKKKPPKKVARRKPKKKKPSKKKPIKKGKGRKKAKR